MLVEFVSYVLASMGFTVLIVWPQEGPSAWMRESVLRPLLPGKAGHVLDCYVCLGFWTGLALSPVAWWLYGQYWCWSGCLVAPAVFWLALNNPHD